MPLVLWVQNLQTAPLATAYNISVRVLVAWDENEPDSTAVVEVTFTYLVAGQTTAFKLTDVRSELPWLFAQVLEVTYEDIFGTDRLTDAHGALRMLYDRKAGTRNDRSFQLSR